MAEQERPGDPARRGAHRVEEGDGQGPGLHREDLAHRQVGRARSRRGEEERGEQEAHEAPLRQPAAGHEGPEQDGDPRRAQVAQRHHRSPPHRVEQPPEQEGAHEVRDPEERQVVRDRARAHPEELSEQGAEVEGEGVVEERLPDEQREPQRGPLRVAQEGDLGDLRERDRPPLAHGDRLVHVLEALVGLGLHLALDGVHDALGLLLAPVDEQPARALGDVAPDEEDEDAEPAPTPKARRQPTSIAKIDVLRNSSAASAAAAAPIQ